MNVPFSTPARVPVGRNWTVLDAEGFEIIPNKDTTDFIATAINSHEALVDALENAPIQRIAESDDGFIVRYKIWFREVRYAALALAKGKKP